MYGQQEYKVVTMDNVASNRNPYLLIGGFFSLAFALFQLSALFWSQDLVRYFGGPATAQAQQPILYAFLCIMVAALVAACGLYAISGAGQFRPLPFLRTVLIITTVVYLLRGLALFQDLRLIQKHTAIGLNRFMVYSIIALCIGVVHMAGVIQLLRKRHVKPVEQL